MGLNRLGGEGREGREKWEKRGEKRTLRGLTF